MYLLFQTNERVGPFTGPMVTAESAAEFALILVIIV